MKAMEEKEAEEAVYQAGAAVIQPSNEANGAECRRMMMLVRKGRRSVAARHLSQNRCGRR